MNVTFYVHGMISFGAIVGGMIATSGDEAFVMLAQFPGTAMVLFGLLFVSGILFSWVLKDHAPREVRRRFRFSMVRAAKTVKLMLKSGLSAVPKDR